MGLVELSLLDEHQYHCMCCNKIYTITKNNDNRFCDNCQGSWSKSQSPGRKLICQQCQGNWGESAESYESDESYEGLRMKETYESDESYES